MQKFGSIAWQNEMASQISNKMQAGIVLNDFELAFVETQLGKVWKKETSRITGRKEAKK